MHNYLCGRPIADDVTQVIHHELIDTFDTISSATGNFWLKRKQKRVTQEVVVRLNFLSLKIPDFFQPGSPIGVCSFIQVASHFFIALLFYAYVTDAELKKAVSSNVWIFKFRFLKCIIRHSIFPRSWNKFQQFQQMYLEMLFHQNNS